MTPNKRHEHLIEIAKKIFIDAFNLRIFEGLKISLYVLFEMLQFDRFLYLNFLDKAFKKKFDANAQKQNLVCVWSNGNKNTFLILHFNQTSWSISIHFNINRRRWKTHLHIQTYQKHRTLRAVNSSHIPCQVTYLSKSGFCWSTAHMYDEMNGKRWIKFLFLSLHRTQNFNIEWAIV